VDLAADRPAAKRLEMCRAGLAAAGDDEATRLALAALAGVPHREALALAEELSRRPGVRGEAEAACLRIAASIASAHPREARSALRRLHESARSAPLRAEAGKALAAARKTVGYLRDWLAAGPYRQQGKQCRQLYDVAFPPEKPHAEGVAWKPAPHPADASLAWQVDLAGVVGGDHRVAYIRTRVWSPRRRRVRLEIGTDDGIKLWVNGKLVHANNAVRGLQPGQDKADATLREGWNDLLAKITQHTLGCGACVRVLAADGSPLEDLRCDPHGRDAPPGN
jgi:hypothetical protein